MTLGLLSKRHELRVCFPTAPHGETAAAAVLEVFDMRYRCVFALVALFFVILWVLGCSGDEASSPSGEPELVRRTIGPPPKTVSPGAVAEDREDPSFERLKLDEPELPASTEGVPAASDGAEVEIRITMTDTAAVDTHMEAEYEQLQPEPDTSDDGYITLPGDSLAVIAGREDVFGDPLKWVVLYQLNRDRLEGLPMDERLPERPVPEGTLLRYGLTGQEGRRFDGASKGTWVVNVVSSLTADRIDGHAVRLLEHGYPVYISRATVEEKKWMRLRVGFFDDRDSAFKAGKRLQEVLGQEDFWPVKIGPEETAEYADILRPLYGG